MRQFVHAKNARTFKRVVCMHRRTLNFLNTQFVVIIRKGDVLMTNYRMKAQQV